MPRPPGRILSVIAPMTQLNTPYPSTAFLTGFLRSQGFEASQVDLAIELALDLLSPSGVERLQPLALARRHASPACAHFVEHADRYRDT
ncbi:MAG TPA: radical SAM protein, partial [Rubrivivax sp.]|nr:radical SAM protein [Rubrivivax sp.]